MFRENLIIKEEIKTKGFKRGVKILGSQSENFVLDGEEDYDSDDEGSSWGNSMMVSANHRVE